MIFFLDSSLYGLRAALKETSSPMGEWFWKENFDQRQDGIHHIPELWKKAKKMSNNSISELVGSWGPGSMTGTRVGGMFLQGLSLSGPYPLWGFSSWKHIWWPGSKAILPFSKLRGLWIKKSEDKLEEGSYSSPQELQTLLFQTQETTPWIWTGDFLPEHCLSSSLIHWSWPKTMDQALAALEKCWHHGKSNTEGKPSSSWKWDYGLKPSTTTTSKKGLL